MTRASAPVEGGGRAAPRSTLARDMVRDPLITPREREWWQAVIDMAEARRVGASGAELDHMTSTCNRLAERCRRR